MRDDVYPFASLLEFLISLFSQAKYKLYWLCVCCSKSIICIIQQLLNVGFPDNIVISGGKALPLLWSGKASLCTCKLDSLHPVWPEGSDTLCCNTRDSLLLLFLDLWNLVLPSFNDPCAAPGPHTARCFLHSSADTLRWTWAGEIPPTPADVASADDRDGRLILLFTADGSRQENLGYLYFGDLVWCIEVN